MKQLTKCISLAFFCCLLASISVFSQVPFQSKGQLFMALQGTNEIVEVTNFPNNSSIQFTNIASLSQPINALAYRSTDHLLYAIGEDSKELLRIDANGSVEVLATLSLSPNLIYSAGDISPDGATFLVVGTGSNGFNQEIVKIDLNDPSFPTQSSLFGAQINLLDIAYHPTSGSVYGFDGFLGGAVFFDPNVFNIMGTTQFMNTNSGDGVFIDAFGDLFAYGKTANGAVDAIFDLDEATGEESVHASGSFHNVADLAFNFSSVEINCQASPASTFPCSEIEYVYTIANATGQALSNVELVHQLPAGFTFVSVESNPIGGSVVTSSPGQVKIEGMNLNTGIRQIVVKVEIGDLPDGIYPSQAQLLNLPGEYGGESISDNPVTNKWDDPTNVNVNVFDVDEVNFNNFFCQGNGPFTLVADQFGNNIQWSTGATQTSINVFGSGTYSLVATSGCQAVTATYEVTIATCPFTIEMSSEPLPPETFPCSEIVWRYIIENDSGEEREGFHFVDTLPDGFQYLEILGNAFGGEVLTDFPSQGVHIEDMTMALGFDTLDFLVAVADIPPGDYFSRGVLTGLPSALGTQRLSDDPNTPLIDSTTIKVLGTLDDSIRIDTHICPKMEILLNAAGLGKTFLWENGSTDSLLPVAQPGTYWLTVFDGCDPSYVEYFVADAPDIQAGIFPPNAEIFLSETLDLEAQIFNEDDSLFFQWVAPNLDSITCLDCLDPTVSPLHGTVYKLLTNNEFCSDSAEIQVFVDNTRRIYAPNVFSPNGDGINDYFYLQSPDFGHLLSFTVTDRWGNQVFSSGQSAFNDESSGWDGTHKGEKANLDTYLWRAQIRFLDELVEEFYGTVMLLR